MEIKVFNTALNHKVEPFDDTFRGALNRMIIVNMKVESFNG
jgi:hypothetical protein